MAPRGDQIRKDRVKRLRGHLQAGKGRRLVSWILAIAAAFVTWQAWPADPKRAADVLSSLQKTAFVTMAFAVTAYNLRTRVVDLLLKNTYRPEHLQRLSDTAKESGRRLTSLVLLFTITSLLMGLATFLDSPPLLGHCVASGIAFLFGYSLIAFTYILFAFERLEAFILDRAVVETTQKEIERLTPAS
jgi:hypothetical protein